MRLSLKRTLLVFALVVFVAAANFAVAQPGNGNSTPTIEGRVVAAGIPGASTISSAGVFLPTSPIGNPANPLNAFTKSGKVLDPARILVGSNSNFGASLGNAGEREGTILSIDPRGDMLVIGPNFATAGGQASTIGGRVQVFTANNSFFLNSTKNPGANTVDIPGASNPLGISNNLAFGRLWPANAPNGLEQPGTSSILDPQGFGLAGAPNPKIGGEYFGNLTNRGSVGTVASGVTLSTQQTIPGGLNTAAVATTLAGPSPDGTGKAVFFVVEADGSIVQESTLEGLDGLVPPGTIAPIVGQPDEFNGDDPVGVTPRFGVVMAWEPNIILFVSEPFQNTIAVLDITQDPKSRDAVFRASNLRRFSSDALNQPVDLAPVHQEATDVHFTSNTILDSDSDFYVANRGDNTIVRMSQTGQVISVRKVARADGMPLGDARLNGIATSPDGTTIWVTVTGRLPGLKNSLNSTGAVLELAAF